MVVVSALVVYSEAARLLQRCASDTRLQAAQTTRASVWHHAPTHIAPLLSQPRVSAQRLAPVPGP